MLLKSIEFVKTDESGYPYDLPFFGHTFTLTSPITILVGENGAGKSSLLKLLNDVLKLYRIDANESINKKNPKTLKSTLYLPTIQYVRTKPKGFYFSAEDFTTYIQSLEHNKQEAYQALDEIEKEYANKSDYSKSLARMPHMRTLNDIDQMYQKDLLSSSHGEAYLDFFKSRLRSQELYLLDEPETPLSIQNQITMLSILDDAVSRGNQFIIATHSPILMSIPGATIYEISGDGVRSIAYDDIESVRLLKHFLNHKEQFFKHLYEKKSD
jgi:predicted ATPase